MASSDQRVNEALFMGVRRALDGYAEEPKNRDAAGRAIGKRLRGTYGFDLRRMADMHPERTAEELYALIIVPGEAPWDTVAAIDAAGSMGGARDAARARRQGPFLDPEAPNLTPPAEIAARVAEIREALKTSRSTPLAR